jgi:hypothetical protein
MTDLLNSSPYGGGSENQLLDECTRLARHHLSGCPEFGRMWPGWASASSLAELPYVHVGVFKHVRLLTEGETIKHGRTLESSSTSGVASQITLDAKSSALQAQSSRAILQNFIGTGMRPLLVLDSVQSLRRRGQVSARIAAAMSLQPFSSETHFILEDASDASSVAWDAVAEVLANHDKLLVYGFTWILWLAWGDAAIPASIRAELEGKEIQFVHSGGWKKLEELKVDRPQFDSRLLSSLSNDSSVLDYYGLVEQVGVIFPLCNHGFRHVPSWAAVVVRDSHSLQPLVDGVGQLQLINVLAYGSPYFSVLTEDLGRLIPGECRCHRRGQRFELVGRLPKAEVRGCANV